MRRFIVSCLLLATCWPTLASVTDVTDNDADRRWHFRVYLDDSQIGTHEFELRDNGSARLLKSKAAFDVKFLFFTAYRYRHSNSEEWVDGCLAELDAHTVTNGDAIDVSGQLKDGAFVVETSAATNELPPCIMTFAYWNPDILEEGRLLNPQTGEFLDVDIETLGPDTLEVRGKNIATQRFRVTAKDIELKLWYSGSNEWVGLESVAKGGRLIRYELI